MERQDASCIKHLSRELFQLLRAMNCVLIPIIIQNSSKQGIDIVFVRRSAPSSKLLELNLLRHRDWINFKSINALHLPVLTYLAALAKYESYPYITPLTLTVRFKHTEYASFDIIILRDKRLFKFESQAQKQWIRQAKLKLRNSQLAHFVTRSHLRTNEYSGISRYCSWRPDTKIYQKYDLTNMWLPKTSGWSTRYSDCGKTNNYQLSPRAYIIGVETVHMCSIYGERFFNVYKDDLILRINLNLILFQIRSKLHFPK